MEVCSLILAAITLFKPKCLTKRSWQCDLLRQQQTSTTIITAHPYDGADMLREHKMPKEIIDIAEQHHGTSLLKFFYHKANQDSETQLPETQFRYPGPKSQTKVGSIVQIADSVEAAVRSISKPTPDKIVNLVRKIINLENGKVILEIHYEVIEDIMQVQPIIQGD